MLKTVNASKRGYEEEGSESVEEEPQKQLKRGKCVWLDAGKDIGSADEKVPGLYCGRALTMSFLSYRK